MDNYRPLIIFCILIHSHFQSVDASISAINLPTSGPENLAPFFFLLTPYLSVGHPTRFYLSTTKVQVQGGRYNRTKGAAAHAPPSFFCCFFCFFFLFFVFFFVLIFIFCSLLFTLFIVTPTILIYKQVG